MCYKVTSTTHTLCPNLILNPFPTENINLICSCYDLRCVGYWATRDKKEMCVKFIENFASFSDWWTNTMVIKNAEHLGKDFKVIEPQNNKSPFLPFWHTQVFLINEFFSLTNSENDLAISILSTLSWERTVWNYWLEKQCVGNQWLTEREGVWQETPWARDTWAHACRQGNWLP